MDFESFKNKFQKEPVKEVPNEIIDSPIVSVCVQTYQHAEYIKDCLEGILMQKTTFPFEILLGEDQSTDGTREICLEYAKKYPDKIRLFLHHRENNIKINGNPTGRFNFVYNLFASKGKYIALCEGDDYWTDPLKLQKQVDFLEGNEEYVCSFHLCETLMDRNIKTLSKQHLNKIKYNYTVKNLLTNWNIPTASIVLRNEKKFKFPSWFTKVASGDIALIMLIFEKGKFKLIEEYMSVYRNSGKGISIYHTNYRMIHFRAVLYTYLNEFFEYKYEKEIYDALNYIYLKFSDSEELKITKKKQSIGIKLIRTILKKINL